MRRPTHPECNLLQIEQNNNYRELAANHPDLVDKGKSELGRIGIRKTKSIFSFIRTMSHLLAINICRPATRYKQCAYYYVGEQLTTNENFRDKFYQTNVSDD